MLFFEEAWALMGNHLAHYDCLAICSHFNKNIGDTAIPEVHLFAYLSCLLSLYKDRPVSLWGYGFSVTSNGYPFSADLDEELNYLLRSNYLRRNNDYLEVTPLGKERYEILDKFSLYVDRETFIEGACSTALVIPTGKVRRAISLEPKIHNAVILKQNSLLLGEGALSDIYKQFGVLASVIGMDTEEMVVPAIVWLTYISELDEFGN